MSCPTAALRTGIWPTVRLAAVLGLLPAEVLTLSLAFDATDLAGRGGILSAVAGHANHAVAAAIAAATATVLLQGPRLRGLFGRARLQAPTGGLGGAACLAGHAAALTLFTALSAVVFSDRPAPGVGPAVLAATWALSGAATVGLWAMTFLRGPALVGLARGGGGALLTGMGAGAAAWGAGRLTGALWRPMGGATLMVSYRLLSVVCPDAYCRPEALTLGTPAFEVEIAPHCSGYEGIGLIWVFLAVYLWAFRGVLRYPHVLLMVPVATAAIWLTNAARIAALVALGSRVSVPLATGGFHSQAGWLGLNAVALGVVAATHGLPFFAAKATADGRARGGDAAPYLAPFAVLMAAAMLTGAFTPGPVDVLYPVRTLAVAGALWYFRAGEVVRRWSWSWAPSGLGAAVFVLWMALEPAPAGVSPLAGWLPGLPRAGAITWLAFRAAGSTAVVPLVEELAFRGYLTRRLISADFAGVPPGRFTWPSFLISSALFGGMHSRWLAGTLAGMLYATAYYRRGRLTDAVLAHATTNALIAAYALATADWSVWA